MADDELTACRKQNEELRAKLCKLVPEWKNLKVLVQKLTASEAAAVARAEQLSRASNLSSPSSATSGHDEAAVLRAKLSKLVPEWKRLKEANKSLSESESSHRLKAHELESQLDAINTELATRAEQLQEAQDRISELGEAANRAQQLEQELEAANMELGRLRDELISSQELQSRLDSISEELQGSVSLNQEYKTQLDAAYAEREQLSEVTRRAQELESELESVNRQLERLQQDSRDAQNHSATVEALQAQTEQQEEEITRLKKRLEKAMQRPTKMDFQRLKHENAQLRKMLSVEADVVRALKNDITESRSLSEKLVSLSEELADLKARFSVCQSSRDSLIIDGDKLEAENRMLHIQIEQLLQSSPQELNETRLYKDGLSQSKSLSTEIQDDFSAMSERYNSSLVEISNLNSALTEKTSDLTAIQSRIDELLAQLQTLETALDDKTSELNAAQEKIRELLDQLQASSKIARGDDAITEPQRGNAFAESDGAAQLFVSHDVSAESDSDKFHHYQNRIETLEEELLELSTSKMHLQQTVSMLHTELQNSQESIQQSSSYLRSELDFLLQILSDKERLIQDLSSQLNDLRAHYDTRVLALKSTVSGLRSHSDRLQEMISVKSLRLEGQDLTNTSAASRKRLREAQESFDTQYELADLESSLKRELDAAKTQINEQTRALHDAQRQVDDLRRELEGAESSVTEDNQFVVEDAKSRIDEQDRQLDNANLQITEFRRELEDLASRRHLEVQDATVRFDEQTRKLEDAQALIDELREELQVAQLRIAEQNQAIEKDLDSQNVKANRELEEAQLQNDEIQQELQAAQARMEDQNHELKIMQERTAQLTFELESAQARIEEQARELKNAQLCVEEQKHELEAAQARIEEQARELKNAQLCVEEQKRELEAARSENDEQRVQIEDARRRIDQLGHGLQAAESQLAELRLQLETAHRQLDDQSSELESAQSEVAHQSHQLSAAKKRIEEQSQLGRAIVHSYNELRGHYELLMAKMESGLVAYDQILRSQSSKSLSPRKSAPHPNNEPSPSKPAVPARSASVPVKKRRTLKEFLIKLFERPIYDENGKPVARVDLTEDTTFVWDPVKRKYIDLNAPESEEKSISKPPPRPFAQSQAPQTSLPPGTAPPPRMPNRSLTASRYALPEGQSNQTTPQKPSSTVGSRYALTTTSSETSVRSSSAVSFHSPASATVSSINSHYSPPVINSFEDVVVITSDYHSLVACLLALQKELACAKRAKFETDLHVTTLVRQIKNILARKPIDPTTSTVSDSLETGKLIYCILAITGIVSALTQISA